jgi:hypothetical protein
MSQFQSGADALNALNATNEGGAAKQGFASFKSGTEYKVRILGTADLNPVLFARHLRKN